MPLKRCALKVLAGGSIGSGQVEGPDGNIGKGEERPGGRKPVF